MKQTIGLNEFVRAFENYNRQEQFSRAGLKVLFNYLEEIDPDMELDVIGLCCDFTEAPIDEVDVMELQDNTTVLVVDDSTIIYQVC
jgi:hypothetical protein